MSYKNLNDALSNLDPDQVDIKLDPTNDEHEVTLTICGEGLAFILDELKKNFDDEELLTMCPSLKKVDTFSLITAFLNDDYDSTQDVFDLLVNNETVKSSSTNRDTILGCPRIGDVITSTREVTGVGMSSVTYKDQNGRFHTIDKSSWKGFGKGRDVTRRG